SAAAKAPRARARVRRGGRDRARDLRRLRRHPPLVRAPIRNLSSPVGLACVRIRFELGGAVPHHGRDMVHVTAAPQARGVSRRGAQPGGSGMMRTGSAVLLLCAQLFAQGSDADRAKLGLTELRRLPVLSGTRFQPLESYAREVVLVVTGDVEPKR